MGEDLHSMMLRRTGVQYNPEIVEVLQVKIEVEQGIWLTTESSPRTDEMMVMTVRFAIVGSYPTDDTPIRPVRKRKRHVGPTH